MILKEKLYKKLLSLEILYSLHHHQHLHLPTVAVSAWAVAV